MDGWIDLQARLCSTIAGQETVIAPAIASTSNEAASYEAVEDQCRMQHGAQGKFWPCRDQGWASRQKSLSVGSGSGHQIISRVWVQVRVQVLSNNFQKRVTFSNKVMLFVEQITHHNNFFIFKVLANSKIQLL